MLNDQRASTSNGTQYDHEDEQIREIHALTPPHTVQRRETWGTLSHQSSFASMPNSEGASSENFTSISREFSALVLAGTSSIDHSNNTNTSSMMMSDVVSVRESGRSVNIVNNNLGRIREDELMVETETNPLAIVADNNPLNTVPSSSSGTVGGQSEEAVTVQKVKKEEVEAKIAAWQNAKVAKINNRFKREDAVINGWENEEVHKANSCMKKVERKLEEKRAKALEKMQNVVAKAHRKAEEKRASAEGKRGVKVARVLEIANVMRVVGRPPSKRSFFKAVY